MIPRPHASEIAIIVAVATVLTIIWAVNGYEDTWLYVGAGIIAIPSAWFIFGEKDREK